MLNRIASIALTLLAVALFVGCQTEDRTAAPGGPRGGETFQAARAVEVIDQTHGDDAALEQPTVALIQDRAALERLGAESLNDLNVDFDEHDVVVVALGEQPTGGYWAHITGVQQVGEVLYVQGMANQPGEDEAATQALTYPYAIAIIAKTNATAAFSDIESVRGETQPD